MNSKPSPNGPKRLDFDERIYGTAPDGSFGRLDVSAVRLMPGAGDLSSLSAANPATTTLAKPWPALYETACSEHSPHGPRGPFRFAEPIRHAAVVVIRRVITPRRRK